MWDFLDRLTSIVLPRIRDFRGLNPRSFDGNGNYSFGVNEQLVFPEIDYDDIDATRGMDITIVTTATQRRRGTGAVDGSRIPFQAAEGGGIDGEEGSEQQSERRSPSSRCADTRGASAAAVPARSSSSSACAVCASGRWHTTGEIPGITKASW